MNESLVYCQDNICGQGQSKKQAFDLKMKVSYNFKPFNGEVPYLAWKMLQCTCICEIVYALFASVKDSTSSMSAVTVVLSWRDKIQVTYQKFGER